MNIRIPLTALLVAALLAALPAPAQQAGSAPALSVQDADIRVFIQDVGRATGTTFIVDPRVQGKVSLARDEDLSSQELLSVLVALLRANGLVAVPNGRGVYRVVPDDGAAQQPASLGFATRVFPLRRIDAKAAAEAVRGLVSRGGVVVPAPSGNALLVADYADNLLRLRDLIARMDVDNSRAEVIRLRNSSAREIASVIAGMYGNAGISALPIETSNALMLRGEPRLVAEVRGIIGDLDNAGDAVSDVRVVRLQHASAEELLPVLQQVIGQPGAQDAALAAPAAPAPLATPPAGLTAPTGGHEAGVGTQAVGSAPLGASLALGPGRRARVARYPGANAIIINADADTQRMLVDTIAQLDVRREQVLVEALVVEISDEAAKRLGSQLLIGGKAGSNIPFGSTSFPGTQRPGILELAAGAAAWRDGDRDGSAVGSAARSLLQYNGGLAGLAGETSNLIFGLIIDAVRNDAASNLLSTPSVLTLDNAEARILVGQEVPVTTGEILGGANVNAFRTIERQDVGVQLVVRPQINAGGGITLKLRQEVSAIAGPVSANSPELILNKREVETAVIADDGAIVVLGGLLDQGDRHSVDKVPLLGDIPLLGGLFRTTSRSRSKTNLMVFIRPTIVRDRRDAERVTAPRYDYMRRQQLARPDVQRADLDALLEDYFRTTPPAMPGLAPQPAPAAPAPRPRHEQ
ncbi:type II secretion system secretin GspD [Luteimonas sp. e5]